MITRYNVLVLTLLTLFASTILFGVQTKSFTSDDYTFYDKGEMEGVGLDQYNTLTLSPELAEVENVYEEYIWNLAFDASDTMYVASGGKGHIYRVSSDRTVSPFYQIDNPTASAIVADASGTVYIAGIPRATLYRVGPDKKGEILRLFEDIYIWDMVFDEDGNLYIACGGKKARIIKMTPSGRFETFFELNEEHFICLTYDKDKRLLYAGTEGDGMLIAIDKAGEYTVLYDTQESEVHDVVVSEEGEIYFSTASRDRAQAKQAQQNGDNKKASRRPLQNSLYKLDARGVVSRLFYFNNNVLLSLIFDNDNNLYIGTGDKGNIYKINDDGIISIVATLPASQIFTFGKNSKGDVFVGTGNNGKLYRMDVGYADEGTYTSEPLDTENMSTWGRIAYRADVPSECSFEVFTRSGNVGKPDDSWSDFEPTRDGHIQSPPARFLQYRLKFFTRDRKKTPAIKYLSISYVPKNMKPELYNVQMVTYTQQKTKKQAPKKPSLQEGEAMVVWNAYDGNGDQLEYTLFYKREGERVFKMFQEKLTSPYYTFDMRRFASGIYVFKVIASDHPFNSKGSEMTTESVSIPFKLDTTAPRIQNFAYEKRGENIFVLFEVRDELSFLTSVRVAVDGDEWRYLAPRDNVFDSTVERFELTTKADADAIAIEVMDEEGNVRYVPFLLHQ